MALQQTASDTTYGITLEVYHSDTDSAIFLKDASGILGRKYYTRRIHKYEANADYSRLNSELQTYGYTQGLLPEWERITQAN